MLETTIASRFRILSELGQGGFSKTFIAEDCHLPGRPKCVIKQLQPPTTDSLVLEITQRMFDREAQVLYKLGSHDRIPHLLAHFDYEKKFYLAIEFIEGKILSEEIYDGYKHSEKYVLNLLQDVLPTLAFVHAQNVIHRDIKPANIIRRASDHGLVLIDFGAVKEVATKAFNNQEATKQTVAIGSHGYMPDEQANGRPKLSSDLYSLGMVCIQALTGVSPKNLPEDARTGEVIWHHLAPQIDDRLRAFLDKLIRSHFTLRFESAIEALESFSKIWGDATDYSALKNTSFMEVEEKTNLIQIPPASPKKTPPVHNEPTVYHAPTSTLSNPEPQGKPASSTSSINPSTAKYADDFSELPIASIPDPEVQPTLAVSPHDYALDTPHKKKINILLPLSLLTLAGSAIAGYMVWQNSETDKRYAQEVVAINTLFAQKNYRSCITRAGQIPPDSTHAPAVKVIADNCQKELSNQIAAEELKSAENSLKQKKYQEAIKISAQVNAGTTSHPRAMEIAEISGKELIKTASQLYQEQGKLPEAIALLKLIPNTIASGKTAARYTSDLSLIHI
jgi:serine/threonine-protein kinase